MEERSGKLVAFPQESSRDVLNEVLREGARQMLVRAIEAKVQGYVAAREELVDGAGHRLVVRNGYLPARTLQTALGELPVQQPRVRDRRPAGEREAFQSAILPPYLRRTKSLEELLPWLYLKGVSTGDFSEALAALLGPEAPGLSPTTITRLKAVWEEELATWQHRSLAGRNLLQRPARGTGQRPAVHLGAHGRHRGGQEGAAGGDRRLPGKRAVLA
jgi:putative transposase